MEVRVTILNQVHHVSQDYRKNLYNHYLRTCKDLGNRVFQKDHVLSIGQNQGYNNDSYAMCEFFQTAEKAIKYYLI